ncbi:hypothetical protein J7E50_08230 [Pedobacter sp. ISL-68]|nr:hypothetical protein [Pedobacter sp. ISL-64]MBT2590199.1 hypothetical protein [Pedobacter sp. ISL-68]
MGSCTDIDQHVKTIQHLDEFISVASHELKTPITSLNASLQLMERMVDLEGNERLFKLMSQTNRSVEKVRTLSRTYCIPEVSRRDRFLCRKKCSVWATGYLQAAVTLRSKESSGYTFLNQNRFLWRPMSIGSIRSW